MAVLPEFDYAAALTAIKQSDLTDAERLAQAFDVVTRRILSLGEQEVELARAVQDTELLVKNQIKLETLKTSRQVFEQCYRFMLGGSPWDV